ncbi:uncharacterized protein LOC26527291 [Drosophila mojavensis]|uniref:Uncharacterized protein n=1 Tax=Drosophila mojavensis TaxID=7230 RepID=A0A0Q9X663_DROMO|nr:uncharacterized protein LOC26527291 [Drosophila mojavensis]KRG03707.1 uncharacterized protein Dmoj_GI25650 [Drosophila mojavensis]
MSRLLTICLLSLALAVQCVLSENPAEGLNIHIRGQLQQYEKYLANDDGSHKEDLQKLIGIYETALKTEDFNAKQTLVNEVPSKFSPEFGQFVQSKLQEDQINDDISGAISFYKSLLAKGDFKADIEKALVELESLQKQTQFEAKRDGFLNLEKGFSPEFINFLKSDALPQINNDLKSGVEFFEKVLAESDVKYATEIKDLKAQAEAALADSVTIDDKQKTLYEIRNPDNADLIEYLKAKFAELN